MDNLVHFIYGKRGMTRKWLQSHGFKPNLDMSVADTDVFTYRFPIYKYGKQTMYECELNTTIPVNRHYASKVTIEVIDSQANKPYYPFYHNEWGRYDTLFNKFNEEIDVKLKKLGLRRKKKYESKY